MNHDQRSVRTVMQVQCTSDLQRAAALFGQIDENGCIPIVLCPRPRLFGLFITIPTGVTAICASSGADMGDIPPGTHIAPPWVRVMFLVPNQACTYNYDVVSCPTQDNVMVEVDVTLVFRIVNARQFCLGLGAQKFDDMLKAVCEEAIRTQVRNITHKVVYELRGSGADQLLNTVNKKFESFGVVFVNATITNVLLPDDVASALQRITQLDQKLKEQIKSQEFEIKKLNDQYDLSIEKLKLHLEREQVALSAKKERLVIESETRKAVILKHKEIAIIEAEKAHAIGIKTLQAEYTARKIGAETEKASMLKTASTAAQKKVLEAHHWSENVMICSEADLVETKSRADVLLLEGNAEKQSSKQLKIYRDFNLKSQLAKVSKTLASSSKLIIGGKEGGRLIADITASDSSFADRLLAQ